MLLANTCFAKRPGAFNDELLYVYGLLLFLFLVIFVIGKGVDYLKVRKLKS